MKNRAIILTEAGPQIGFGHLTRCQSIADLLKTKNYQVKLLIDSQRSYIKDEICINWPLLCETVSSLLSKADIVIVDSFLIDDQVVESILNIQPMTLFIDDFVRRDYKTGIVLDWTINAEHNFFTNQHQNVKYLLGSKYCSLRSDFNNQRSKDIQSKVKKVLITFGGSDIRNLSKPILRHILKYHTNLEANLIIGQGFPSSDFSEFNSANVNLIYNAKAKDMKSIMETCDLAICGGGQTLYELAFCGLPSIVISLSENQFDDINGFKRIGFINYIGAWDSKTILSDLNQSLLEFSPINRRENASIAGQKAVDGLGGFRLIKKILHIIGND